MDSKGKKGPWGGIYVGPASELASKQGAEQTKSQLPDRRNSQRKDSNVKKAEVKAKCAKCNKKCSGDILRVEDRLFHIQCFNCRACKKPLNDVGYFERDGVFYCPQDYHSMYGIKCPACSDWVEGEVVQVLGETYHQKCFRCFRCKQPFPAGQKVTFTGREHLCQNCLGTGISSEQPVKSKSESEDIGRSLSPTIMAPPPDCAACGDLIHSGQVLLALDLQWHIWCFKCETCGSVLHGEYMAKDGRPYCIRDYNAQFGVRCDECGKFIAGRVLQAGEYHFHPSCARCFRCGEHFGDAEEMFMQGDEIWHPRCNDLKPPESILHGDHSHSRSSVRTPHGVSRSPRASYTTPKYTCDFGQHLTYSYLLPEPNLGYLRQPISPHPPETPQFHTPHGKPIKVRRSRISMLKTGMQKLTEALEEATPRAKSPHMNNEEPIELSHFPGAHFPEPHQVAAIDRDDFPAPPFPYAVEELKRRLSTSDKEDEDEDEVDAGAQQKLLRAEEELKKYEKDCSLAHIFTKNLEEAARKAMEPKIIDPRSASRTPNAKKNPIHRCRYESPINASPSRYLSRPRPWERWEKTNRAATSTIPYYQVPKPGYGLAPKAATLPAGGLATNGYYDMAFDDIDTARSSVFSDLSSTMDNRRAESSLSYRFDRFEPRYGSVGAGLVRSSLPDMSKPPKIYPLDQLQTTATKLPEDVDRCHLERHLAKEEFERLFKMTPIEFYKLPEWKRVNLKRKAKLF